MHASVVVAYRDFGCEHRRASYGYAHAWYERLGWEVVVDTSTNGRAAAINAGVRAAGGDVIVQSDPDSLVPEAHLREAVALAADADGLVVPHSRYLYLTLPVTAEILAGRDPFTVGPDDSEEHGGAGVGNVTVFSRATWERSGGFDERFTGGWGGDDAAFAYAADAFCGPTRRVKGDVVHLWHPRPEGSRPGTAAYARQFAIVAQYRDAAKVGREAVQRLVRSR